MAKKFFIFLFITIFFTLSAAQAARAEEIIRDFVTEIRIDPDSRLNIQETISYDFGDAMRHGIYRDIPYKYQARGGNYNLRLDNFSVTDENGLSLPFTLEKQGEYERIKIGDPAAEVTGLKVYRIAYTVRRAINYFNDHDELYWNATGNEWQVTIEQSRATVILPEAVAENDLQSACFAGPAGSQDKCVSYRYVYSADGRVGSIVFTNDFLKTNEGLTVVVGWPKGLVAKPSAWEAFLETVRDNIILGLPLLVFLALFYLWRTKGRDPAGRGTIIAEFGPPDNLTPAEVGTIIDENAQNRDISAQIIDLAVHGYLKIEKKDAGGLFKKDDYILNKLKDGATLKNEFERKLFTALFSGKDSVRMSDLKNKFYKDLEDIKRSLYQDTVDKNYFAKSPAKVRRTYFILGAVVIFFGFFLAGMFGFLATISLAVSGAMIMIFGYFMPVKTGAGVLAREKILGLKEYLRVAEADRIKFHNAPEKKPEIFEQLLPYAMVLGVENEWAKQFEGIYNTSPAWYSDPNTANFTALALINNLNRFDTRAQTTIVSRPQSASGGGSGFSGGFSGGGFGGGGGGSW